MREDMAKTTILTTKERLQYHIMVTKYDVKALGERLALIERLIKAEMKEGGGLPAPKEVA
jgi:Trp operon repressor